MDNINHSIKCNVSELPQKSHITKKYLSLGFVTVNSNRSALLQGLVSLEIMSLVSIGIILSR